MLPIFMIFDILIEFLEICQRLKHFYETSSHESNINVICYIKGSSFVLLVAYYMGFPLRFLKPLHLRPLVMQLLITH